MKEDELLKNIYNYAFETIQFDDYKKMGIEQFHKWAKENFEPVPMSELEIGKEYSGVCRNANTAVWDGKVFHYKRIKFGYTFDETINHYEEDNGYDLFVPIRKRK